MRNVQLKVIKFIHLMTIKLTFLINLTGNNSELNKAFV